MKESVIKKLKQIVEQYHSIGNQLLDEETQKNNTLMIELSKELSRLEPVVKLCEKQQQLVEERNKTAEITDEKDEELKQLVQKELQSIDQQLLDTEEQIVPLLLPAQKAMLFLMVNVILKKIFLCSKILFYKTKV